MFATLGCLGIGQDKNVLNWKAADETFPTPNQVCMENRKS